MKIITLVTLVASLALATSAMADNTVYNSKANTGKILAPRTTAVVLTASSFDGVRLNPKVQTVEPAGVPVIQIDKTVACSKPMDSATCARHCGT